MTSCRSFATLALVCCLCLPACSGEGGDVEKRSDGNARRACSRPAPRAPAAELRFRVESTPGIPGSFDETKSALCARLDKLRLPDVQVRQEGPDLVVRAPRRLAEDVALATMPGELRFYDWEPNAVGRGGPDVPFAGSTALFQAVLTASRMSPRSEDTDVRAGVDIPPGTPGGSPGARWDRLNDSAGDRFYLFGADRRHIAGPALNTNTLRGARGSKPPPGSRVLKVPRGIIVVQAEGTRPGRGGPKRYFTLEDDVELSRSAITTPRAPAAPKGRTDQTSGGPVVEFGFTAAGRGSFAMLTRRVAVRGSAALLSDPETAAQRFAITLDHRIVSLATVDGREHPEGIDGRTGAQIGGFSSLGQARRAARLLQAPPLPGSLVPIG